MELRALSSKIQGSLDRCGQKMDAYTKAHLTETKERIDRALEAGYTYNAASAPAPIMMMLGRETNE